MAFVRTYKKDLLAVVLAVGAASLVFVFGVQPKREALATATTVLRTLDAEIAEGSVELEDLEALLLEKPIADDFALEPGERLMPRLLEILADLGKKHRLEITAMKPDAIETTAIPVNDELGVAGQSQRLSIQISVNATYRDIGEYFNALEAIPVLIAVRDLKIKRINAKSALLQVDFRIETYSIKTHET